MSGAVNKVLLGKPLNDIFSSIPRRYDVINIILTWGGVNWWRRKTVREILAQSPVSVLDVGCGTGALTLRLMRQARYPVKVTGLDCSQPMLELAVKKAETLVRKPSFVNGCADALPFPDGYFDCVTVSFALRNLLCENPQAKANLAEILRVIAPGGRFVAVETSQPMNRLARMLFHLYLRGWVFPVGWLVSGDREAYRYLSKSAACFYPAEEVEQMLTETGFNQVSCRRFLFGAVALHVAIKPGER